MYRYVRDLVKSEIHNNNFYLKQNIVVSLEHSYEFLPYNSAYLQKDNTENDLNPPVEEIKDRIVVHEENK